jgi:dTDP-4-dehydrorhamnose 3,5-epimerase
MGHFTFTQLDITGLLIIEPRVYRDDRGSFMESYHRYDFSNAGLDVAFVQSNESRSYKGVLRGLHFQRRHPQGKLVRVVCGEVYDVAVDIRPSSTTFGRWCSVLLSGENRRQFYIPPGFAHGFLTLSHEAYVLYQCSDYYDPDDESGIVWNDEELRIDWPLHRIDKLCLSEKDRSWQGISALRL